MNHLKISTRLTILIGVLAALLLLIGGIGLNGIAHSNEALKSVYLDRTVPSEQLGVIQSNLLANQLAIADSIVTPVEVFVRANASAIEANNGVIATTWSAYMATTLTTEEAEQAKAFETHYDKFMMEGLRPVIAALRANDLILAQELIREKIRPLYVPVRNDVQALMHIQTKEAKAMYEQSVARYERIRLLAIVSISLGMLFAISFGVLLVRGIQKQLGTEPGIASGIARAVAQGDLSVAIAADQGEPDSLMVQLRDMRNSLVQVVSQVRQGSDSMFIASSEIAQGNHDLSARTEQQASALQQTVASM